MAAGGRKELWLVSNAAHIGYLRASGPEYRRRVLGFSIALLAHSRQDKPL
jgi:hypothetical protein